MKIFLTSVNGRLDSHIVSRTKTFDKPFLVKCCLIFSDGWGFTEEDFAKFREKFSDKIVLVPLTTTELEAVAKMAAVLPFRSGIFYDPVSFDGVVNEYALRSIPVAAKTMLSATQEIEELFVQRNKVAQKSFPTESERVEAPRGSPGSSNAEVEFGGGIDLDEDDD